MKLEVKGNYTTSTCWNFVPLSNKSIMIYITGLNRHVVEQGCQIVDRTQRLNNHAFVMVSQPWRLHSWATSQRATKIFCRQLNLICLFFLSAKSTCSNGTHVLDNCSVDKSIALWARAIYYYLVPTQFWQPTYIWFLALHPLKAGHYSLEFCCLSFFSHFLSPIL